MRYIMMVLRGNMRRNKGVHISVFVLMLIISLAFCSVLSYYTNSIRHDSEAMEEVGYGGMLAALYGENRLDAYGTSADKIIKNIGKCDAVQEVKAADVVYLLLKDCNGKGGNSSFVLNDTDSVLTYDQYDVDNKMTDRRLEKGEVSVPFSFIGMYDCKIGDTVELGNDNGSYTFKVASFFEDPYMGSSVMGIKTILISDEDFADLKAKAAEDNRSGLEDDKRSFELSKLIIIDKKPGLDLTEMEFERELNNVSDFASYCWITLSKEQAGSYMLLMTKVFSAVLLIFVVLLLVAAMIVLGHNIGSSIEMDFVNIGILKAVGMTNASVKLALLAGYMCTVAAGLFAGIPLAIPILKIINSATLNAFANLFNTISRIIPFLSINFISSSVFNFLISFTTSFSYKLYIVSNTIIFIPHYCQSIVNHKVIYHFLFKRIDFDPFKMNNIFLTPLFPHRILRKILLKQSYYHPLALPVMCDRIVCSAKLRFPLFLTNSNLRPF